MLDQENSQRVIVQDIHMPFFSMVVFMVKWAIAAIPAFLILIILGVLRRAYWVGSSGTRQLS